VHWPFEVYAQTPRNPDARLTIGGKNNRFWQRPLRRPANWIWRVEPKVPGTRAMWPRSDELTQYLTVPFCRRLIQVERWISTPPSGISTCSMITHALRHRSCMLFAGQGTCRGRDGEWSYLWRLDPTQIRARPKMSHTSTSSLAAETRHRCWMAGFVIAAQSGLLVTPFTLAGHGPPVTMAALVAIAGPRR